MAVRKDLPSLTGLLPIVRQPPSLERLGYFQPAQHRQARLGCSSQNQTRFRASLWWPCASTRPDGAGEWGGAGGCKDFAPAGACGRSATFRSLQRANGRARWKIFARADLRKLKRRERRAPDAEFGGMVSQGSRSSPAGADRQPWTDGFESRWDSRMGRDLQVASMCACARALENVCAC